MTKQDNRISRAKKLATQFRNKLQKPLNFALRGKKIKHQFDLLNVNDLADLVQYCFLITAGKLDRAYQMQHELDTVVYEKIPDQLYNLLGDIVVSEEME